MTVPLDDPWLSILHKNQDLAHVSIDNIISASLLASGDGTEIIYHHLTQGAYWTLEPEPLNGTLEFLYILQGSLQCHSPHRQVLLTVGDCVTPHPVSEQTVFHAVTDTFFPTVQVTQSV